MVSCSLGCCFGAFINSEAFIRLDRLTCSWCRFIDVLMAALSERILSGSVCSLGCGKVVIIEFSDDFGFGFLDG